MWEIAWFEKIEKGGNPTALMAHKVVERTPPKCKGSRFAISICAFFIYFSATFFSFVLQRLYATRPRRYERCHQIERTGNLLYPHRYSQKQSTTGKPKHDRHPTTLERWLQLQPLRWRPPEHVRSVSTVPPETASSAVRLSYTIFFWGSLWRSTYGASALPKW